MQSGGCKLSCGVSRCELGPVLTGKLDKSVDYLSCVTKTYRRLHFMGIQAHSCILQIHFLLFSLCFGKLINSYLYFLSISRIVLQKYPSFIIEGDTYPPPAWRAHLANLSQLVKYSIILMTVSSFDPFAYFGYPTPNIVSYASENKRCKSLLTYLRFQLFYINLSVHT
ncbi:unnamed protein product [Trichobilharzia regenti]|nr:unnamed protein product [Trichobilharzia regenti]